MTYRLFFFIAMAISLRLFSDCPPTVLEFDSTFQSILGHAHELKAADSELAASAASRWQAAAYPNPELNVAVDNMGNGSCNDHGDLFVGVTQDFELGGKRSARIRVAEAEQCLIAWDREILKNELFGEALHAFIDIAVAQERLDLTQQQYQLAQDALSCITETSKAGKVSPIEVTKGKLVCGSVKLLLSKEQSALSVAKKKLRSLWDCTAPDFDKVCFPLFELEPPPSLEDLYEALNNNPEIARAEAEVIKASKIYHLERAQRIPDMAVQVGVTTERFRERPTIGFEIDIPLPIFDQNRGNICRAMNEQDEAIYNQMEVLCRHKSALTVLYEEWENAYAQAIELRDQMLPPANESYRMTYQGFNEGKFGYIDLRDARNTLFDIQQQYLSAVEEYHNKRADVLQLIGCMPATEN